MEPAHEQEKTKPVEGGRPDLPNETLVKLVAVERAVEENDCPDHLRERDHRVDALQWLLHWSAIQ